MRFAKSVANRMAEDIRIERRRLLRKMNPEETYFLMVLADDLENIAMLDRLEVLANKFERGQHHIGTHLEIGDETKAQEIANEMATDMRELRRMALDADRDREEVTEQRLREAEEMVARYGGELQLVDRSKVPKDISLN